MIFIIFFVCIPKDPVHHDWTKHVEIDWHFIKEKLEDGYLSLLYVPTADQNADILTKALPRVNFENMNFKLGVINIYDPAWRAGDGGVCWNSCLIFLVTAVISNLGNKEISDSMLLPNLMW